MKYLECKCCGFLAVIPKKDSHEILCPFCFKCECSHCNDTSKFKIITKTEFMKKAKLRG
jgi:hypothetical protein